MIPKPADTVAPGPENASPGPRPDPAVRLSPQAVQAARGEILPFTALRGLAAWWVVGYHFRENLPPFGPGSRELWSVLSRGALAVDLFFIMSGFVMALSYGPAFHQGVTLRGFFRFIALRLGRVYPLHILILVLFISVPVALSVTGRPPLDSQFPWDYFVQSVFLVQASGIFHGLAWNLPAWSISTEMMFYLLCPAILVGTARGLLGIPAHLVVMACVLVMIAFIGIMAGGLTNGIERYGVFRCIFECTLGVLLFRASAMAGTRGWLMLVLLAVSALCGWVYATGVAPDYAVVPLAFACLLWSLLHPRNWLGRAISNPVLLWLGRLSYATYMVHFLLKYWVKFLLGGNVSAPILLAAYLGSVLVASVALHYLVELPTRRLSRHLVRRWFDDRAPKRSAWTQVPGGVEPPNLNASGLNASGLNTRGLSD